MAIHPNILAWKIPRAKEPGGLQSMGLQRVGHYWVSDHLCIHGVGYPEKKAHGMLLGTLEALSMLGIVFIGYAHFCHCQRDVLGLFANLQKQSPLSWSPAGLALHVLPHENYKPPLSSLKMYCRFFFLIRKMRQIHSRRSGKFRKAQQTQESIPPQR